MSRTVRKNRVYRSGCSEINYFLIHSWYDSTLGFDRIAKFNGNRVEAYRDMIAEEDKRLLRDGAWRSTDMKRTIKRMKKQLIKREYAKMKTQWKHLDIYGDWEDIDTYSSSNVFGAIAAWMCD